MQFMFESGIKPRITEPKLEDEFFTSNKINPKVTIITPSFNQGVYLEECILSVARQSFKDFEHLIIDNLSTDSTFDVIEKYPHVTFISEQDKGVQDAIIKGCFLAKGDYVILIPSSDGILDFDWLKDSVDILENDKEVDLVWGLVQRVENDILKMDLHFPEFWDINHFRYIECPQKENWFDYWKYNKPWGFEISMVVKRDIFIECYVQSAWSSLMSLYKNNVYLLDFLEFYIFFNKKRYNPYFVKKIACFARNHDESLGSTLNWGEIVGDYYTKIDNIDNDFTKKLNNFYKRNDDEIRFTPNFDGVTEFRITIDNVVHYFVKLDCTKDIIFFISTPVIQHPDSYLEFFDKKIKIN